MTIKPAGKIAIVVVVVVGAFFLLKPLILGKDYKDKIEVKDSTVHVVDTPAVVVPVVTPTEAPKNISKQPVKKPVVAPVKKPEAKKDVKKKKERENLDINF